MKGAYWPVHGQHHRFKRRIENQQFDIDIEQLGESAGRVEGNTDSCPVEGFLLARMGLPRLMEARSLPVSADPATLRASAFLGKAPLELLLGDFLNLAATRSE